MTEFRYMDRVRAREGGAPHLPLSALERASLPVPLPQTSPGLSRFMGGSPLAVLARLIVMSFLVGAAMAWLDIRPAELLHGFESLLRRIWLLGFDGLRDAFGYVLVGAMIVVPLWFFSRLFARRG